MSPMRIIILLVAAGAAVLAAFVVRGMASAPAPVVTNEVATETVVQVEVSEIQVLVSDRDLSLGEILAPEDMKWVPWPEQTVNIDYYTDEVAPTAIEDLTGSVVRTNIYMNEPIMPQKVVGKGDTGFMAALLAPGMRAISVEISEETASGGFIVPNDRVDVILTHEIQVESGQYLTDRQVSTTIIENARVLAIDQIFRQDDTDGTALGRTATLELDIRASELLSMGQRMGSISLALRSITDAREAGDVVTAKTDMLDGGGTGNGVTVYRNGRSGRGS